MNKIDMTILIGAAIIAAAAVTAANLASNKAPPPDPWEDAEIVTMHPGGSLLEIWGGYLEKSLDEDYRLRIEGLCASACTFFLKPIPRENVCYGENAMLGFHGVWAGFNQYQKGTTAFMLNNVYPAEIKGMLLGHGWDFEEQVSNPENLDMIWIDPADLRIQKCEDVLNG